MKALLITLGWLSLVLGIIGIVVPLLPTVPFVLLSATLFARSSPCFHRWLLAHRYFGPLINDWQHHGGLGRATRRKMSLMIALSFGVSFVMVSHLWVRVVLVVAMAGLLIWMRYPDFHRQSRLLR